MNYLWVFIGGGLGSVARFGISQFLLPGTTVFPVATLLANLLACMVMGAALFFTKLKSGSEWSLFILTGFCGGFSTFSTFSMETLQLMQSQQYVFAGMNILISVVACIFVLFALSKFS